MPDDPDRVGRQRNDLQHETLRDYRDEIRTGAGAAILLGVLLLVAIGGFVFYFAGSGDHSATTEQMRPPIRQPATNGSAAEPEVTGSSGRQPPVAPVQTRPKPAP